jgi:hypothetical protein
MTLVMAREPSRRRRMPELQRPNEQLLSDLGDIPEYGGAPRVLLPESYYIATVSIGDPDVSNVGGQSGDATLKDEDGEEILNAAGDPIPVGGSPFSNVSIAVEEGPFTECGFDSRFYFTPGKGRNIGFINHAVKAVTGKPVDLKALDEFRVKIPSGDRDRAQQAFRFAYLEMTPEQRLAFMSKYARLDLWEGRGVVVKVGREMREFTDEATGAQVERWFNRIQGFYALDDAKKGAGFVRSKCHEKQEAVGLEEGSLESTDAATA